MEVRALDLMKGVGLVLTISSLGFMAASILLMSEGRLFASLLSFVTGMILLSSGISILRHGISSR